MHRWVHIVSRLRASDGKVSDMSQSFLASDISQFIPPPLYSA